MKIREMFEKDVQRPIDGVIKADDAAHLANEVEEYVLTNEISKELERLLEVYTDYSNANGVWISGFFGSGKSHLLKMLAHLLGDVAGQDFSRESVAEAFRDKAEGQFLPALLKKADKIAARSLLFNIDQKAAVSDKSQSDALLRVFVRVFDESRGYFGGQGHVARFERDLDLAGQFDAFQESFLRITGSAWLDSRKNYITLGKSIDSAYADVVGEENAPSEILAKYRNDYSISIEDFAEEVKLWLDTQEPGSRLNFFVDEVGQFVGDNAKLMLSLQTIAESLNTKCQGRAWVFVTSQEDLDKVIGDRTKQQGNDFSKIQARFKTRVSLTSADVEEVIRKRLLEKNAAGTAELEKLYAAESDNFRTLFDFPDGAKTYRLYADQEMFAGTYPFVSYQFPLFQSALIGLSEHNAFTGRHAAVGERSMLGVVQQVTKEIGELSTGYLAGFDHMFAGIRDIVQSMAIGSIDIAQKNLPDPDSDVTKLAIRVLKALFLVKYVDGFRATARNLTVLLYDRFGLDLPQLSKNVVSALELLEVQTYIQRNGDAYEFLTNEEQDIEKEIKSVDIDASEISQRLFEILQKDVVKQAKFRYAKTGQDFPFGYKLDDQVHGPQKDLTLHFFTPDYPYPVTTIRAHSTGLDEVRVVLSPDERVLGDLRLLLKTEKYVKRKQGPSLSAIQQRILSSKSAQNTERGKELVERVRKAVVNATLIVYTVDVDATSEVADSRISDAMSVLVTKAYPQLGLLGGKSYAEQDITKYVQADAGGLEGVDNAGSLLDVPSEEIYSVGILQRDNLGEQVTVKKLVDQFQGKPYGWDYGSILVVIAYLFGMSKIMITLDGNSVKRSEVPLVLRNSQKHAQQVISIQKTFDAKKVKAFRDFVAGFFDEASPPKDAMELARHGSERLRAQLDALESMTSASNYPFTSELDEPITLLESIVGKSDEWYLTEFDGGDALLDLKESVLDPIQAFLKGAQRTIYDDVRRFLERATENLSFLPAGSDADVRALLEDPGVFRGTKVNQLQSARQKLEAQLDTLLADERKKVAGLIRERRMQIESTEAFMAAPQDAQQEALAEVDIALARAENEESIAQIKLAGSDFVSNGFASILGKLAAAKVVEPPTPSEGDKDKPAPSTPSQQFTPIGQVVVTGAPVVLSSEADVDEYLSHLREALVATIGEGKRITL